MEEKKRVTATGAEETPRSAVFQLIQDHKLKEQVFHISIPNSPSVPYLSFRSFRSVVESEAFAIRAQAFAEKVAEHARKNPELSAFVSMDKTTIAQAWILGNICESEGFDAVAFLQIADDVPILFRHIRTAVDEASYGVESVLYSEGLDRAKKD